MNTEVSPYANIAPDNNASIFLFKVYMKQYEGFLNFTSSLQIT